MSGSGPDRPVKRDPDALLREGLGGAEGDDAQLRAFQRAFAHSVELPAPASVIGEPVTVVVIDYAGSPRRGLTATCRRGDGSEHVVALADVCFPEGSDGARHVAGYRMWLGLEAPPPAGFPPREARGRPADSPAIDLSRPVELVVLSVKDRAARCRLLGQRDTITLRATRLWDVVPGEIATVRPRRQWRYAGHPYLSGDIVGTRLDVEALGLEPLRLQHLGTWDPAEEYWGEEDQPLEDWARSIVARGPRPEFKMEQVVPSADPLDPDRDPIIESTDLRDGGDTAGARRMLQGLLEADLRCLDAHAHLGHLVFDHDPAEALRHFGVGVRIGELSLPEGFEGVLRWACVDNRPFYRCLHGYGLCLWRLDRRDEAGRVFERMLWMNPSDNQGIRFLVPAVRAGQRWEASGASQ
jgi:hypothetical protein